MAWDREIIYTKEYHDRWPCLQDMRLHQDWAQWWYETYSYDPQAESYDDEYFLQKFREYLKYCEELDEETIQFHDKWLKLTWEQSQK